MAITVADNFSYQGKKPLDGRDTFTTLAAMKAYAEASVYDGCLSYCDEDGKRYEFKSTNTVDPTTGKWREYSSGGGQTYNDFTGATSSTAGAHGLVPAPSAGDEGKVLFGNGLWGNLPSVDLSVLSNEAFIFSETEKPVGMWTDRKILYAKTVNFGTLPDNTSKGVSSRLSNVLIVGMFGITYKSGYAHTLPNPSTHNATEEWYYDYSANNIVIITHEDRSSYTNTYITLFYTKTTDSPLPSDVKFAGVTASGEVILERTLDFGENVEIPTTSWYTTNMSNSNVGKMIGAYGVSNSGTLWNLNANCDSGNYVQLQVCRHDSGTSSVRWATVKYTLAS